MTFRGDTRYTIATEQLRDFMEQAHEIHQDSVSLIHSRWIMKEKPNREQRRQMEFLYGSRKANQIMQEWYTTKQSLGDINDYIKSLPKEKRRSYANKIKEGISNSKKRLEKDQTRLHNRIKELKERYSNVLMDCGFDQQFIDSLFLVV
jgi:hypothetical protein